MSAFISIITVVICLFTIICIHELGHFAAVKAAGVKVLEFGIGFPPRLFGFKRGDTEYTLNLIPLGAFVKPEGEQDPEVPSGLAGKSPWARMGVSAAGPLANFVLAFVLFSISLMIPLDVIVGNGVMVNEVTQGSPAAEAGIQPGDIIMSVNGKEIHSTTDLGDAINSSEEGSAVSITLLKTDGEEDTISLVPVLDTEENRLIIGVLMNPLGVMVTQVDEGSPAAEAGIQTGDVILAVDGERIHNEEELSDALASSKGEEVTVLLLRDDTVPSVKLIPDINSTGLPSIGIEGIGVQTETKSESYPFFQAIAKGGEYFIHIPGMMVDAISAMGGDYGDAVVGPVGVVQITGETTKYGFSAIIGLAGLISFGIGLFNLFPIPPLDGGGILIAGIEGVRRGKRLSPRAMQLSYAIGAALLFTLFIVITYNDILRLIRGDSILP